MHLNKSDLQSVNTIPLPIKNLNTIVYHTSRKLSMFLFDLIKKVIKITLFKRKEVRFAKNRYLFPVSKTPDMAMDVLLLQ